MGTMGRKHIALIRKLGFSTAEVTMSALIVGILMAAALNCAGSAMRSQVANGETGRASSFAGALLAEILELPFENPDGTPSFGLEKGEKSKTRADFDDVDDYHNWNSPPAKKDGTALSNSTGLTTTVQVTYGNPDDLSDSASAPSSSNVKRITVNVLQGSRTVATAKGVVTK